MALIFCKIIKGYDFNQSKHSEHNRMHIHYWKEYENKCIKSFIENDDIYMIVWDNEKPKKVKYASESVWSYSKYASFVDASTDIIEKYNKYIQNINRSERAKMLKLIHNDELYVINKHKLNISAIRILRANSTINEYNVYLTLLKSNYRNNFKKKYQAHVLRCIINKKNISYYDKQSIYTFINSVTAENK